MPLYRTEVMATDDATTENSHVAAANDTHTQESSPVVLSTLPSGRRTTSGGLFSRFSFLRPLDQGDALSETQSVPPKSKKSIDDESPSIRVESLQRRTSLSDPSRSHVVKQRKRKGSLRKSALLGGRRFGADGKDRKASPLQDDPAPGQETIAKHEGLQISNSLTQGPTVGVLPREAPFVLSSASSSRSSLQSASTGGVSLPDETDDQHISAPASAASQHIRDSSTTEEDDYVVPSTRPGNALPRAISQVSITSTIDGSRAATSYFPPQPTLRARSSQRLRPSPLQHAFPPAPEPYSYAETEYWGWVILFLTWLLFTVGMGSCLDIWSWAWDVGETPYAPPELEDDPTLPIVGYYPALIVLTGVVAWVWITVAWVGMKYFRHAKIEM